MTSIIKIIIAVMALQLSPWVLAMTDAQAINISGQQRMLTQRMMKNYLMLGTDIRSEQAQEQLNDSVLQFELQLRRLDRYAPTDDIKAKITAVKSLWSHHKGAITETPDKATLIIITGMRNWWCIT